MAILRSMDGKFYNIPDDTLGEYDMGPEEVKEQIGAVGGGPEGGPGPQGGGPGAVQPQRPRGGHGCWHNCWHNCWSRNCWRNCF